MTTQLRKHSRNNFRMSRAQQVRYRKTLWPAAAAALGVGVADEDARRDQLERILGNGIRSTTELVNNNQVTLLFRALEAIAAGGEDVEANMAALQAEREVTDPVQRELADLRGLIVSVAFADEYVAKVAEGHLRREGLDEWRQLPADALRKVLFTLRTRRREQLRKDPAVKRPPARLVTPYDKREDTPAHLKFMRALRAAVPSGRLEEITPALELQLLGGIKDRGVEVCECPTCVARRAGDPGNHAAELREIGMPVPRAQAVEVDEPF